MKIPILYSCLGLLLATLSGCEQPPADTEQKAATTFECDQDNGGLVLPAGFCAAVIADNLGIVRHIAVREPGIIYTSLRNRSLNVGGILVLQDIDGDQRIDSVERVGDEPGMGIRLYDNYLYFASDNRLVRFPLSPDTAELIHPAETIVTQFPEQGQHSGKPFAIAPDGKLYVNIGSTTNACQPEERTVGLPGTDPCPELEQHGGIWQFDARQLNQRFKDGQRYASGIRNAYAIDWQQQQQRLYVVQHGRDHLNELWPDIYTPLQEQQLPAEELIEVVQNQQYAWPYCYFDPLQGRHVLAPEYGGDGNNIGRCKDFPEPVIGFPAHYGPNDLVFYHQDQFPEQYHGGAFIAFHGSYLVNASQQVGYQVVFVPFKDGHLSDSWQVFADQFVGNKPIQSPQDADYRPTGLAVGDDGSLYISDSVQGRIWRVIYQGK